jgi:hypothetical protein
MDERFTDSDFELSVKLPGRERGFLRGAASQGGFRRRLNARSKASFFESLRGRASRYPRIVQTFKPGSAGGAPDIL